MLVMLMLSVNKARSVFVAKSPTFRSQAWFVRSPAVSALGGGVESTPAQILAHKIAYGSVFLKNSASPRGIPPWPGFPTALAEKQVELRVLVNVISFWCIFVSSAFLVSSNP